MSGCQSKKRWLSDFGTDPDRLDMSDETVIFFF